MGADDDRAAGRTRLDPGRATPMPRPRTAEPPPAITPEETALAETVDAGTASLPLAGYQEAPPAGARLGNRYLVVRPLGEGGMGVVVLAVDEVLGQEVALKFVHPRHGDVARLRAEVLLAQKVSHENVCRTYDIETLDDALVLKMEYVAGETLAARIRREGRLAAAAAVEIARRVAAGLGAAHARGVIHCDLKPSNVMIEEGTGRIVLMDFGIARVTGKGDQPSTAGTPLYMAPEQTRGLAVDGRADLYALGCVLYEMLAGEPPYPAPSPTEIAARHVLDPVPDVRARRPEVPRRVAQLVTRLLAKRPEDRPADAAAALAALARPRARLWLAAAAGLAALVLAALAGGRIVYRPATSSTTTWRPAIRERLPAYDERASAPVLSPDGSLLAYASDRDGTARVYVEPTAGGDARAITPADADPLDAAFTHDGTAIHYRDGKDDRLYRVPLAGGAPAPVAANVRNHADCAGRLVLEHVLRSDDCQLCQQIVVVENQGAAPRERELYRAPATDMIGRFVCDRAGQQLVFSQSTSSDRSGRASDVYLLSLDGGPPRAITSDTPAAQLPIFAADDASVIFASQRGGRANLWEIPTAGGVPVALTSGAGPDLPGAVSPDGKLLVFQNRSENVQIYALPRDGAQRPRRLSHTLDSYERVEVTPDGRELIAGVNRGGRRRVVAIPIDGAPERTIVDADAYTLAPDGRELWCAVADGGAMRVFAVPIGGGAERPITRVTGRIIAIGPGQPGTLRVALMQRSGISSWTAPLGGGPATREDFGPWAYAIAAPRGGWTAAVRVAQPGAGFFYELALYAPGMPLTGPPVTSVLPHAYVFEQDGAGLVYAGAHDLHRFDFATRKDTRLLPISAVGDVAVSPDGATFYIAEPHEQTRRFEITNFADRPRPTSR